MTADLSLEVGRFVTYFVLAALSSDSGTALTIRSTVSGARDEEVTNASFGNAQLKKHDFANQRKTADAQSLYSALHRWGTLGGSKLITKESML
jgi:hypothetical protein